MRGNVSGWWNDADPAAEDQKATTHTVFLAGPPTRRYFNPVDRQAKFVSDSEIKIFKTSVASESACGHHKIPQWRNGGEPPAWR
jgi:hypothetical protein